MMWRITEKSEKNLDESDLDLREPRPETLAEMRSRRSASDLAALCIAKHVQGFAVLHTSVRTLRMRQPLRGTVTMKMKQGNADLQVTMTQGDKWKMRRSAPDLGDKNTGEGMHRLRDHEAERQRFHDQGHLEHRTGNKIQWPEWTLIPKRLMKQLENFCRKWLAT